MLSLSDAIKKHAADARAQDDQTAADFQNAIKTIASCRIRPPTHENFTINTLYRSIILLAAAITDLDPNSTGNDLP